jgi:hypothetical protein
VSLRESPRGGRSTAAVLWLMILLVFLPIVAVHAVARIVTDERPETHASR